MSKNEEEAYKRGVAWACARLIEFFDQPTMAAEVFTASGFDLTGLDKTETRLLKKPVQRANRTTRRQAKHSSGGHAQP